MTQRANLSGNTAISKQAQLSSPSSRASRGPAHLCSVFRVSSTTVTVTFKRKNQCRRSFGLHQPTPYRLTRRQPVLFSNARCGPPTKETKHKKKDASGGCSRLVCQQQMLLERSSEFGGRTGHGRVVVVVVRMVVVVVMSLKRATSRRRCRQER